VALGSSELAAFMDANPKHMKIVRLLIIAISCREGELVRPSDHAFYNVIFLIAADYLKF
jgi:hypothetical protein